MKTELEPGTYLARLTNYAISENSAGNPTVVLKFEVDNYPMTKFLSLKEGKAREFTLKTLATLGFRGKSLADIAAGPSSGCLDMESEVEVVVRLEPKERDSLELVPRISFINKPGKGVGKTLSPEEVKKKINIDILGEMKRLGINPNEDEITPFD